MKTTLEILEEARDLIRDEKNWCQGTLVEFGKNFSIISLCSMGALKEALSEGCHIPYSCVMEHPATTALEACGARPGVASFNDTHTHAEVLELFNLAIADELSKQHEEESGSPSEPVLSGTY